jgi:4-hydroxy-tetrahydrodipicolinate synthase
MTYQPLTGDEVFELFHAVTAHTSLPVVVYDNPGTTHFNFSTELYGRIAQLDGIASIKIPPGPTDPEAASARVREIRAVVPDHVTIGISGDPYAATGLAAGCDTWYSVIAGVLPQLALNLAGTARDGRYPELAMEQARLEPLWVLFTEFGGSIRVAAALAEALGLVPNDCLPRPILGLNAEQRSRVRSVMDVLGITTR